ncbi:MAG TPA: glycine cleavage system aminomethyltransferase GcvT [Chloroflexota bacterium]|nr:glycine cleavage system aminomethyltransferase GcvT [Chloroflexota bacterium]
MAELLHTALNDLQRSGGARMVDFAGWDMPVQYASGILAEHNAVRNACGLFDLSHMGRVHLRGQDAIALAQRCLTRDLSRMRLGEAAYGLLCNQAGGILDDVIAYLLGETEVLFVFNASNRQKDVDWFQEQRDEANLLAAIVDRTFETALIGVQGPQAQDLLQPLCSADLDAMPGYSFVEAMAGGSAALVARTGYTGEDGFELYVEASAAEPLWKALSSSAALPCGLGARDTLRTEAGMPLYGHEIDETTNPYEAGLGWTVSLGKEGFAGREALARLKEQGPSRKLVGLLVDTGGGVPRPGFALVTGDKQVGRLTSGTFSPTLRVNIAMGYVSRELAEAGTRLALDIRGREVGATITKLPFVPHRTRPRTKG